MKKIEQIYQNLSKLDQDKSMHLQFLKQSFIDYKNDLLYLDQFLRGINLKFKQYRRGEVRYFFVYPTVFEHIMLLDLIEVYLECPWINNWINLFYHVNLFKIYHNLITLLN